MLHPALVSGLLAVVLVLLAPGCQSSSCSGNNGKACGVFPSQVVVQQSSPRLHFTTVVVTEGTCEPPQCRDVACTELRFIGAALPSVPSNASDAPLPEARCRFEASTVEGESVDMVVRLAHLERSTLCCCTGSGQPCNAAPRTIVSYAWSVSANGVDLGMDIVTLPATWDAGTMSHDAAMP